MVEPAEAPSAMEVRPELSIYTAVYSDEEPDGAATGRRLCSTVESVERSQQRDRQLLSCRARRATDLSMAMLRARRTIFSTCEGISS